MRKYRKSSFGRLRQTIRPIKLIAACLLGLALLATACGSEGDSSNDDGTQPPATASDAVATTSTTEEPRGVSVPVGIPELPLVDVNSAVPQPSAEDAVFDFLFLTLSQNGYTLVSECTGLTLQANPNLICISDVRTAPDFVTFTIGQPLPGVPWYSVFVQEVPGQGWRVFSASAISR